MPPFRYAYYFIIRQYPGKVRRHLDCFMQADLEAILREQAICTLEESNSIVHAPKAYAVSRAIDGMNFRARVNIGCIGPCRVDSDEDMDGDAFEKLVCKWSPDRLKQHLV